ncbi:unnamed protein product [Linum tenue]|uniref:Uncharacterized protein n=2 Tax=Linum tenue TaxID=586396 RepID=A0AAV0NIJ7_9ROSI|nr:unnamed protein product [Linum tenue]
MLGVCAEEMRDAETPIRAIFPDDIARFKHAYSVNTSGTYDEEEKEALTILIAKSRLSIVGLSHLSRYMELSDWPDATKLASKYLTELKQVSQLNPTLSSEGSQMDKAEVAVAKKVKGRGNVYVSVEYEDGGSLAKSLRKRHIVFDKKRSSDNQ